MQEKEAGSPGRGERLVERIRQGVIGAGRPLQTPFGSRPLVYADYTASGRALDFIEDALRERVLPWYANTHTESSFTGAQTTALREEARGLIRRAVGGDADSKVIFCGSGATAAIDRIIDVLGLRLPAALEERHGLSQHIPADERPVVFIGPYEHHSNELPWRESLADVVTIPLDSAGAIDQGALRAALEHYRDRPLRIGSFSAASNVTGIRSDITAITALLKRHGALAFWDYAAAGPYVEIAMNAPEAPLDAVFLSPHKFIGGPGTPGILIARESLLRNRVPAVVGGGTVAFVNPCRHRFLSDPERREEGGTPAIIEAIRAGLVFKLQQAVGTETIERLEQAHLKRALNRLAKVPGLEILGGTKADRLAILSLRFHRQERELHYGFVVALLNDLFGIQARGGCSCAGPYGHTLLGLDARRSEAIEAEVVAGHSALRPGWVRLNFNYFLSQDEVDYLVEAIAFVAEHGARLLPCYRLDRFTGLWRFRDWSPVLGASLNDIDFLTSEPKARSGPSNAVINYRAFLAEARRVVAALPTQVHLNAAAAEDPGPERYEALRWYLDPGDTLSDGSPRAA